MWPLMNAPANLWDISGPGGSKRKDGIPGYSDGYVELAPVGTFPPNENDLRDLAGNVWEWVQESFGGEDPKLKQLGVVRGGSWRTVSREELLAAHRRAVAISSRTDDIGFRVVLSSENVVARDEE